MTARLEIGTFTRTSWQYTGGNLRERGLENRFFCVGDLEAWTSWDWFYMEIKNWLIYSPRQSFILSQSCVSTSMWCRSENSQNSRIKRPSYSPDLWLAVVSTNCTWPSRSVLPVLWRSKKLHRFVDDVKRLSVFSTRYSYAVQWVIENGDERGTRHWITNVYPRLYHKTSNFGKRRD